MLVLSSKPTLSYAVVEHLSLNTGNKNSIDAHLPFYKYQLKEAFSASHWCKGQPKFQARENNSLMVLNLGTSEKFVGCKT